MCQPVLEPYFSFTYYRSGRLGKFIEVKAEIVQEYLDRHPEADQDNLPKWFVSAMELSTYKLMLMFNVLSNVGLIVPLVKRLMHQKAIQLNKWKKCMNAYIKVEQKVVPFMWIGSRDSQVLTLKAEENQLDEEVKVEKAPEKKKIVLVDTIDELRSTNVTVGSEVGDTAQSAEKVR